MGRKDYNFLRISLFFVVAIVAIAVSSLSLIVLFPPFNYILFFFGIALIGGLFLYLERSRTEDNETEARLTNTKLCFSSFIDWLFIASSIFLLFVGLFGVQDNVFSILAALLMGAFGCGYCLLNLTKATSYFSKLELIVFSFIFSVLISGLLFFSGLTLPLLRNYILYFVFLVLSVSSAIKNKVTPNKDGRRSSLSQRKDLLLLGLAVAFYIILFVFIFSSGFATIPTDATQFYRLSVMLPRTPDLFYATAYLLFILFESSILSLSNAGFVLSQVALGVLPIILIPAFYIMAKEYFHHVDKRLPSLSTVFWVFFAFGLFGWVYYLGLGMPPDHTAVYDYLYTTAFTTYYSTMYGIVGYTFVGFTVSLIAFLAAIFLMKRMDIPKALFYGLFSSLIVGMFLCHVSETVVFAVFLVFWGLISSKNTSIRVNEAINSTLIAFVVVMGFYVAVSKVLVVFWTLPLILSFVLPILLLSGAIVYRKMKEPKGRLNLKDVFLKNKFTLSLLFVFIYVVSSISCLFLINTFNISQLSGVWNVPWFIYPVVLGLNGLLSAFAVIVIVRNPKLFSSYVLFLLFFVYCLVFARLVSAINFNFFYIGYWESRFIYYMQITLALIAPIIVIRLFTVLKRRISKSLIRVFLTAIILSLIVEGGALTTFMNVEYWSLRASETQPSGDELAALEEYRKFFDSDPYAGSGSVTADSLDISSLAAPTTMLPFQDQTLIWSAKTPENPLRILGNPKLSHFYLYLNDSDVDWIVNNSSWTQSYLNRKLSMLPIAFSNTNVIIYNFSRVSPPLPNSEQTLVLPFDSTQIAVESQYFCYDLLSNGLYNYTTAFDTDNNIMKAKTLLLSFDPGATLFQNRPSQDYVDYVNLGGNLVIFNSEGFGFFGNLLFEISEDGKRVTQITSSTQTITLPNGLLVKNLQSIISNEKTLSSYVSKSGASPFITQVGLGEGNLFYVNIAPLVEYLKEPSSNKSAVYQLSGELLKEIGLSPFVFDPLPPVDGYVREIQLDGEVSATTKSMWYQVDASTGGAIGEMEVRSAKGIFKFEYVSSIRLISESEVTLTSPQLTIQNGEGFYSRLNFSNNCIARFNPKAEIVINSNGKDFVISDVSSLSASGTNNLVFWGRTPTITARNGTFIETYTIQGLNGGNFTATDGSFTVQTSDGFSLLENFRAESVSIYPLPKPYNEVEELLSVGFLSAVIVILATVALLGILLLIIRIMKKKPYHQRCYETSFYGVTLKFKTLSNNNLNYQINLMFYS